MRGLGVTRTSAYFSMAPFVGALLSFIIFRDTFRNLLFLTIPFMLIGVILLLSEEHLHSHLHLEFSHEHRHRHHKISIIRIPTQIIRGLTRLWHILTYMSMHTQNILIIIPQIFIIGISIKFTNSK